MSATFFNSLGRTLSATARALLALKTAWERRHIVGQLAALDDHMLRDIGITRHDVLSVLAEPLFRDPSECLAARVAETRRARRATAGFPFDARGLDGRRSNTPATSRRLA